MKLNKNKLIGITKIGLNQLDYKEVKDTITVAQGLYIKSVGVDFYLTLGLTISRYYECMFTASFYLSKTTIWATYGGDIPRNSYQRIGHFLSRQEREFLLGTDYSSEGVRDAWWNAEDKMSISHFLETVRITEDRFLNQPNLFVDIQNSKDIIELEKLAKMAEDRVQANDLSQYDYRFIPQKAIDGIPIEWFKAAEKVLEYKKIKLNIDAVKRLAADAYRRQLYSKR